jgi:RES domain-containing protein
MEAFRLARAPYATSLSGKGAAIKGARWNSPGVQILYTASNRSLAMAEVAVHFTLATLPSDYVMVTLFIPDDVSMTTLPAKNLPINWNMFPHPLSTQALGDAFIAEGKYCILKTPSAVTHGDHNLLINPRHTEFKGIRILHQEPFPFDKRIFKG